MYSMTHNEEAKDFTNSHEFNLEDSSFLELNENITVDESLSAAKSLKTEKAAGSDFILNEYLIASIDILSAHICDVLIQF